MKLIPSEFGSSPERTNRKWLLGRVRFLAVVETTEGVRLQVSFGNETALIYPWQIVIEPS